MVFLLAGRKQHGGRCCGVCSGCWQPAERASQSRWHLSLGLRAESKFTSSTGPSTLGQGFDDAGALGLGRQVGWLSVARAGGGGWSERGLLPVRAPSTPAAWAIVTASSRVFLPICPSSCRWKGSSDHIAAPLPALPWLPTALRTMCQPSAASHPGPPPSAACCVWRHWSARGCECSMLVCLCVCCSPTGSTFSHFLS